MLDVPLNAMWKNCEQEQTRTGKNQIESYDLLQTNTIHEEGSTQPKSSNRVGSCGLLLRTCHLLIFVNMQSCSRACSARR